IVYVLIALAGARTSERAPRSRAMGLWAAQMVLNFTWSPVFFTWHRTGLALIVIAAMLVTIAAFILDRWQADRTAALLFLPYLA
ncbi:TspO/MBR family protein, partial [Escherichia coli]|uniref:TspO/MBR family protein n=1 Tax=Escherichia coli TaxID=562 RepID=UPI003CE52083